MLIQFSVWLYLPQNVILWFTWNLRHFDFVKEGKIDWFDQSFWYSLNAYLIDLIFFCLQVPVSLLITFSACTVLLIAVHMLALMISTCILPNVEAVANLHFQTSKTVFESPHMKMNAIVELAWGFSTVLGKAVYIRLTKMVCLDDSYQFYWSVLQEKFNYKVMHQMFVVKCYCFYASFPSILSCFLSMTHSKVPLKERFSVELICIF